MVVVRVDVAAVVKANPQMLGLVGRTLETGGQEDADLEAVEGQRIAGTVGEEVDRARKVAREQRRARHQIVRRPAAHRLRTGLTDRPEIGRATSELQSLMRISYAVFCLKK